MATPRASLSTRVDILKLQEMRIHVPGLPMGSDDILDLAHDRVRGLVQVQALQVRLPCLQARAPVHLTTVPVRIIEVDGDGVAVRDRHVDLHAAFAEPVVEILNILQAVTSEGDLLHDHGIPRRGATSAQKQFMMLLFGSSAHEDHARPVISIGHLQPKHIAIKLYRALEIGDVQPDVSKSRYRWHLPPPHSVAAGSPDTPGAYPDKGQATESTALVHYAPARHAFDVTMFHVVRWRPYR